MKGDNRHIKDDYDSGGEGKLCDLDSSKTYKGLVGIYVDESSITYIDRMNGR